MYMLTNYSSLCYLVAMEHKKRIEALKGLGLSENEAMVYDTALQLGPSTILRIARTAGLRRTTTYSVVEALIHDGLMSKEVRGLKVVYVAEDPKRLEAVFEEKREAFKKVSQEFAALYNLKGEESKVKYYEGIRSITGLYNDLLSELKPHDTWYAISDTHQWVETDPEFFEAFILRRVKKNLDVRLLLKDSERAQATKRLERNYNQQVKILPHSALTTNILITPKKVIFHQLTPPVLAIVVENRSIVAALKEVFELLWSAIPNDPAQ